MYLFKIENLIESLKDKKGNFSSARINSLTETNKQLLKIDNLKSDRIIEHIFWRVHELSAYPKQCLTCKAHITRFCTFKTGYAFDYCSATCVQKHPETHKKKKNTTKTKYGVESIWQVDHIVEKRHKTCMTRYGQTNTMEMARTATLTKYGVSHVSQIPGLEDKRIATVRSRKIAEVLENNTNFILDGEYLGHGKKHSFVCKRCNIATFQWPENHLFCHKCDKELYIRSSLESRLMTALLDADNTLQISTNELVKIDGKKYFPDLKIGKLLIEIDGNYWHAEGRGGDKLKSHSKRRIYNNNNFDSLFFFEDEIIFKLEIVVSIVLAKLGLTKKIHARKTQLIKIPREQAAIFLNQNHLQGNCPSSIRWGLFFEEELVGVATFAKTRFNKRADLELIRLAFKRGYSVVGGTSKLMSKIEGIVLSYSDNRLGHGQVYSAIGFTLISDNHPSYFYMDMKNYLVRKNRINFQKHKLKKLLNSEENKTEWELAQDYGLDRIWDCGSKTWILTK